MTDIELLYRKFRDTFVLITCENLVMRQFIKYTIVGGSAFFVDYSLLYILTNYLKMNYLLAAACAFSAGLVINYILSIIWVFDNRNIDNPMLEFLIFTGIGIVGLFLNECLLWVFTDWLQIHYMVSKIYATAILYVTNFMLRKVILFK